MKLVTTLAAVVTALVATQVTVGSTAAERADYGDAPDGRPTGYGPQGEFPSLLKSDGARAASTRYANLGKDATTELDSLQVDQDRRDDGVFVRLVPCQASEALVLVSLPTAGQPARGTAFLNLFFDWNRDGRWVGSGRRCSGAAPREWVVRNAPVNLSAQRAGEQLYRVRFRAGSFEGPMWFRATLSVDERLRDELGRGSFARGEVEDSLFGQEMGGDDWTFCVSNPVQHGTSGFVDVIFFGDPGDRLLSARLLLTQPFTPERMISREGAVTPNGQRAQFTYTSLKKDTRAQPVVLDKFRVVVRATIGGKAVNGVVDCAVLIQHASAPASAPPGSGPPGSGPPGSGSGGAARLGWYSGPTANFGSIDFLVGRSGAGKTVSKLQFTSRITCTKGVTSHHVHVDGTFPVRVAGGRETFTGTSTSFEIVGQPIGRPPGSLTITGAFTDAKGTMSTGTLRLRYTFESLGTCDTGTVTWQAPASARPTHTHP